MAPSTRSSSSSKSNQNSLAKGSDKDKDKDKDKKDHDLEAPAKMQGYKISDNDRSRKYGIGANSLEMIVQKANLKFPVSLNEFKIFLISSNCVSTQKAVTASHAHTAHPHTPTVWPCPCPWRFKANVFWLASVLFACLSGKLPQRMRGKANISEPGHLLI